MLRRHGDASPTGVRESRGARPTADAIRNWSRSLDNLLTDKGEALLSV